MSTETHAELIERALKLAAKIDGLRSVNGQVLEADQPDDSTKGMFSAETLLEWLRS